MNALFPAPAETIDLRVLSLGAGVQSTALALMAAHGEIGPMPDCAIFADTGWEPRAVHEHLAWLRSPDVLPFPVHIVTGGDIRADLVRGARGGRWASIPAFTGPGGAGNHVPRAFGAGSASGKTGMIRWQCTGEYKIVPIRRKVRELAGLTRKRSPRRPIVEQWIGISFDEAIRMKPSLEAWQVNRFPLIELGMTRRDCLRWLEKHGYPMPPKSACIGCPYHGDAHWRQMRAEDPDAWADAVAIDRLIRTGFRNLSGEVYLHRSCVPLDKVDLDTLEDRGQLDLFADECEGMCGV